MINLKNLRENPQLYKKKYKERFIKNSEKVIDEIIFLDSSIRQILEKQQKLQEERNKISKELSLVKDKKSEIFLSLSKKVVGIKSEIDIFEKNISDQKIKINNILHDLPNIHLDDVPIGEDSKSNKEIRKVGKIRDFDFKIKSHDEIGIEKNLMDFDTATKISGARYVITKGNIAKLERALINFMIDTHVKESEYLEMNVPIIVNEESMFGTGQLPKFSKEQFSLNTGAWLIPTAEVSLTNIVRDKILNYEDLPLRYVASTPCFRAEAGAAGKDTKGMLRQHQFYKVELVSIVKPEDKNNELERLLNCAESILIKLEIPYRVVLLSSGDMGFSSEKTYDLEAWIPSQNNYREISSCSSCGQFQANRMMSRFKDLEKKIDYVATLNGSGLAVGRTLIALIENNQNKDGSITIPKVLHSYMDGINKL
ncbi:MAG: serine--tRNA ligase [Pseudomonadota bacterium]|jgi:seryl-tRNA synthetase